MRSSVVHDVTVPLNRPEFSMRLSVVTPGRLVKELSIDPTEFRTGRAGLDQTGSNSAVK
jgi:hypothetical protein